MEIATSNPPASLQLTGVGPDTYFGDVESFENNMRNSPAYQLFFMIETLKRLHQRQTAGKGLKTGHDESWKEGKAAVFILKNRC